jgi:hypothetical protein
MTSFLHAKTREQRNPELLPVLVKIEKVFFGDEGAKLLPTTVIAREK